MGELVVYRMLFGLALFHIIMSLVMIGVRDSTDMRFSFQNGACRPHYTEKLTLGRVVDCEGSCSRGSDRDWLRHSNPVLHGTLLAATLTSNLLDHRLGAGFP